MTQSDARRPNLGAYLERIGYAGDRRPTLATLQAIVAGHTQTIAFENLSPFMGAPVRLEPEELERKLVLGGRGGYCFEHNLLLWSMLEALGFKVSGLAARVRWNAPEGVATPRGHMALLVDLDGQPYVVDAGFGGCTMTAPLALTPDLEQPTPHEPFRIIAADGAYAIQVRLGAEWRPLYAFDLQKQLPMDYIASNWYLSTNPASHFVTGLMAARPADGRRHALRNNQLNTHYVNGEHERRILATAGELRGALEDVFRLTLPDGPELERALRRAIEQGAG